MQNDETREICLNYAASVPEWNLALKHEAASELAKCAAELMKVSQMMLASDAADRLHPDRFDYGLAPRGYAAAISDAKYSLGAGACRGCVPAHRFSPRGQRPAERAGRRDGSVWHEIFLAGRPLPQTWL